MKRKLKSLLFLSKLAIPALLVAPLPLVSLSLTQDVESGSADSAQSNAVSQKQTTTSLTPEQRTAIWESERSGYLSTLLDRYSQDLKSKYEQLRKQNKSNFEKQIKKSYFIGQLFTFIKLYKQQIIKDPEKYGFYLWSPLSYQSNDLKQSDVTYRGVTYPGVVFNENHDYTKIDNITSTPIKNIINEQDYKEYIKRYFKDVYGSYRQYLFNEKDYPLEKNLQIDESASLDDQALGKFTVPLKIKNQGVTQETNMENFIVDYFSKNTRSLDLANNQEKKPPTPVPSEVITTLLQQLNKEATKIPPSDITTVVPKDLSPYEYLGNRFFLNPFKSRFKITTVNSGQLQSVHIEDLKTKQSKNYQKPLLKDNGQVYRLLVQTSPLINQMEEIINHKNYLSKQRELTYVENTLIKAYYDENTQQNFFHGHEKPTTVFIKTLKKSYVGNTNLIDFWIGQYFKSIGNDGNKEKVAEFNNQVTSILQKLKNDDDYSTTLKELKTLLDTPLESIKSNKNNVIQTSVLLILTIIMVIALIGINVKVYMSDRRSEQNKKLKNK